MIEKYQRNAKNVKRIGMAKTGLRKAYVHRNEIGTVKIKLYTF